jgi:hypothetical protein
MLRGAWGVRANNLGKILRAASGTILLRPILLPRLAIPRESISEVITTRAFLSVLLAAILWTHCGLSGKAEVVVAGPDADAVPAAPSTLKEQVVRIPAGAQVDVRLVNHERVRGRLGEISAEAFTVQVAKGNQIDARRLAFSDVQAVKQVGGGKGKYVLVGVGIGVVVLLVVAILVTRSTFKNFTP